MIWALLKTIWKGQPYLLGLIATAWITQLFFSPFDSEYTARELYDHLMHWLETGVLYSSIENPPYRVLNYPPLFLISARFLADLKISALWSGRLISLFSSALAFIVLWKWLKDLNYNNKSCFRMLGLLAGSYAAISYLGQFHLQWFAVAWSLLGFFLLKDCKGHLWKILLSGACFSLACFAKQTQSFSCLAALLWLFFHSRKNFLFFLGTLLVGSALLGLGFHRQFGEELWRQTFTYTVGTYSFKQLLSTWGADLLPWSVLFALGLLAWKRQKSLRRDLRAWYFLATSLSLITTLRQGSSSQYFLEWSLALLLWVGPELEDRFSKGWSNDENRNRSFLHALLILQLLAAPLLTGIRVGVDAYRLWTDVKILPALCSSLPSSRGMIPTENPSLVRFCGHEPAGHPFIMANLSWRGLWNQRPFLQDLASGRYPLLVLPFDLEKGLEGVHQERWTTQMIAVFQECYTLKSRLGNWRVYSHRLGGNSGALRSDNAICRMDL